MSQDYKTEVPKTMSNLVEETINPKTAEIHFHHQTIKTEDVQSMDAVTMNEVLENDQCVEPIQNYKLSTDPLEKNESCAISHQSFTDDISLKTFHEQSPVIIRKEYKQQYMEPYVQKIFFKYLKPPPVPEPGVIIIREIRPPRPPTPAPIYIRERPKPPPTPPPLILRELPPHPPKPIPPQLVFKRLSPPPRPQRRIVVERFPPLPPKPRDVLVERWLPYPATPKRKIIYQKAPPAPPPTSRRNIVIMNDGTPQVHRRIWNLGVATVDPMKYQQCHPESLIDRDSIVREARKIGFYNQMVSLFCFILNLS
ncbi:hypothetical protein ACOME3_001794 [Neoechinorhynchus agilis]